ncbi:MAG: hypothetical protein AAFR61_25965 [Bacteroidota bacterium]
MRLLISFGILFFLLACGPVEAQPEVQAEAFLLPRLGSPPSIDGDLGDWKDQAFHDGVWDIFRLEQSPWYEPGRNRLTQHGEQDRLAEDLESRYYMAWDKDFLYLGAIVHDNFLDTIPHKPEPRRWYYKDCVAWFVEAPGDTLNESFGQGDHGFCFVIDPTKRWNNAWWRHGNPDTTFLEEPLPAGAVDWEITLETLPTGLRYELEVRLTWEKLFPSADPDWSPPEQGHRYRMMIVHTDPDGGDYGGHFLIHGKGDPDESWAWFELGGEKTAPLRKVR